MRLDLPESLERVLSSTNLIENLFSRVREVARRVTRWQGGTMILRWTAAGVLEAERSCQLLAQTTHNYTLTKKGGKPALEHTSQRVQRVKLDTDQPSMLPAQHARHRAHFLQQTH